MEPPRRRGKDSGTVHGCGQLRITPAWAGKSREIPLHLRAAKDHPRVGGEKYNSAEALANRQGSPPRGRGKASHCFHTLSIAGITPAWAGKSRAALSPKNCSRDHPRVGGEKRLLLGAGCKGLGSPPRGRGKAQPQLPAGTRKRITPAWAGKSCTALRHCFRCGDHPRVGGEKHLGKASKRT